MKALKILVVVMGVLIVVGVVVLVTLVVNRAAKRPPVAADAPTTLTLPGNARVVETTSTSDRVVLRVAVPGEPDRIYFLDHHTGAVRSIVTLDAASEKKP